jgi:DNA-binding NtrC family response regulator
LIRVEHPLAKPADFLLHGAECRIGSADDNDIVVRDGSVSRAHVALTLVAEGVAIRDLGSKNGVYCAGERVEEVVVSLGTRFTLGKKISVSVGPDATELDAPLSYEGSRYGELLGRSRTMSALFATLQRLQGSLVTVLIEGESGTGKELIARALHDHSRVASGPFVAVNCGALDKTLARGELFGHRRGAFTGANDAHAGAIEEAHQGTLFLDEIGELPKDVQPLLLRFLETRTTSRIGETQERRVATRVVAATNLDLGKEVHEGRFRRDLYHRLAVVKVQAPSLDARPDDIELLAEHFAHAHGFRVEAELLRDLQARSWPGNVRELKNAIDTFALLGSLPLLQQDAALEGSSDALTAFADTRLPYAEAKDRLLSAFTKSYLERLLIETDGNHSEAARRSGLQRGYIGRLVAKLKLG